MRDLCIYKASLFSIYIYLRTSDPRDLGLGLLCGFGGRVIAGCVCVESEHSQFGKSGCVNWRRAAPQERSGCFPLVALRLFFGFVVSTQSLLEDVFWCISKHIEHLDSC